MRKTIPIQLIDDGQALDFEITQMSATQKERWLLKAILILADGIGQSGMNLFPGDIEGKKKRLMRELNEKGLRIFSGISYEKVQPLLDELLECCSLVRDKVRLQCTPTTVDGYVSDFKTLYRLRMESFKVNFPDFFTMMSSMAAKKEKKSQEKSETQPTLKIPRNSQATPTSAGL